MPMFVGDAATPPCDGTCCLADHGESWPDVALVSAAPPPSEALDDLRWHTCLSCRGCCPYPETVGVEGLCIEASSLELAVKQIPEMQLGEPFPGCQTEQRFCLGVVRRPVVEVFGHGCVRASGYDCPLGSRECCNVMLTTEGLELVDAGPVACPG